MVRRRLTDEEEDALAKAAEDRTSDKDWDFSRGKPVNRGRNPTVVLSGRIPVVYAQMLRRMAVTRRCSISDLVKQAIESYAAAPGPQVSYDAPDKMTLFSPSGSRSETRQVNAAQRFMVETTTTGSKSIA